MLNNSLDIPQVLKITRWQKIIIFAMIATALLTLWASFFVPICDGDLWFHMLYGKSILENHTLTLDHTIFSWTPSSNESIYCCWIGQIIYYLLYKYFGNGGVIVFRYIAASTLFIAILLLSRQRNTFYNPITWFTASVCTLLTYQVTLDKPEILSFSFMALIVWNWYKIKLLKQNIVCQIYLFPLLILIWVNSHGGFIYGCLFLLCVGLGETINQLFYQTNSLPRKIYYHLIFSLFLSSVCIFITPYGYEYIQQLVMQTFDQQLHSDFSSVISYADTFSLRNNPHVPVFADIAIFLILLVFSWSLYKKQLDFVPIISNLVFAFLFTIYGRLAQPWIAVFSLSIVYYCSSFSGLRTTRNTVFVTTFFLATLILSGWFLEREIQNPMRGRIFEFGLSEQNTIDEEIDFLKENYKDIRLANTYDHGAYILWKNFPEMKVMVDARYFPYKSWYNEYMAFAQGVNVHKFIEKYPFDAIVVKHSLHNLIFWFYKSKDWKWVFYGKSAAVFVRTSLALSDRTAGDSLNDIREFPIAASAFYTSILAKDWPGTNTILNTMNRNFKTERRQNIIAAFSDIKLSAQMYEQKRYASSIEAMGKAIEKGSVDKPLYAATLLMKAIEDWEDKQWGMALKNTIKSLRIEESFTAYYNLALMMWQIEAMDINKQNLLLILTNDEMQLITKWRHILTLLLHNKINYPQYSNFIINVDKIQKGDKDCNTQFAEPEYR